jgi:nucleotide-binding universal stress UspA family protein
MFRRILLPTDGSDFSLAVIGPLSRALDREKTTVILVEVIDPRQSAAAGPEAERVAAAERSQHEAAEKHLREARSLLHYGGIEHVETRVLEGTPARAIIDEAHRAECDLIAMATHGATASLHPLLGSVAEHVLREARLPVLLVRPDPAAIEE